MPNCPRCNKPVYFGKYLNMCLQKWYSIISHCLCIMSLFSLLTVDASSNENSLLNWFILVWYKEAISMLCNIFQPNVFNRSARIGTVHAFDALMSSAKRRYPLDRIPRFVSYIEHPVNWNKVETRSLATITTISWLCAIKELAELVLHSLQAAKHNANSVWATCGWLISCFACRGWIRGSWEMKKE